MKRKANAPTDARKPCCAKAGLKRQRRGEDEGKTAEVAAQEWQATFDATNDAIWLLDKNQRVVRFNKMAEQMLQRPPQKLIGKHCWEIMHATTGSIKECPLQRTRKNLRRESMEMPVGERWFKVTCDPIVDAAGHYGGAVHIITDITDSKRAEEAREAMLRRQQGINQLQQSLLAPAPLEDKLKRITDDIVRLFEAESCYIWLTKSGDLCKDGCVHAAKKGVPHACRLRKQCLHLMASSGRHMHAGDKDHHRMPFGAENIGLIASGDEHKFLTNDVSKDPRVHNRGWARKLKLVSFAGYQLRIPGGEALGVLALFAKHPILPAEDAALDGLSSSIALVIQQARAEDALRESEANLQLSFDAGRMGHWSWDIITGEVEWSDQCKILYGQPPDVVMSYGLFLQSVHPDDREMARMALKKAIETRTDCDFEKRIVWPDGSVHWTATRARVFCDAFNIVVRMSGIVFNIDDRKQMEQKLEASERMFRSVVENSHTGIYISDENFRFNYVNDELCNLLGYSREELVGSDIRRNVSEADLAVVEDRYLRRQKGENVPSWYEIGLVRKDGSKVFVMSSAFAVRTSTGRVRTVGQVLDITARRKAEEAVRESEARYRLLAENVEDFVTLLDVEENRLYVSPSFYRLTGWTAEEIMQTAWDARLHPDDVPLIKQSREANRAGQTTLTEHRIRCRDGSWIWVEARCKPVVGPNGRVIQLLIWQHDITDRKRAEETLESERNLLRTLIDQIPDSIYVRDKDNRFILANETVARRMGAASPADLIGKTDADFFPAEQAAHFAADDREVFAGRALVNFEEDIVHLNGTGRYILSTKVPLRDAQGKVIALVGIGRDITERKRMEESLRESEQKYRELVQNANSIILRLDPQGRVNFINEYAQRFFGYSAEEILGRSVVGTIVPETESTGRDLARIIQGIIQHPERYEANQNENMRRNGERVWIAWTNKAVRAATGEIAEILCIGNDMTERKRMEEALATSEKRFRDIADHAQEWIWEVDAEGKYTYASQVVEKVLGYTPEETLQKHFHDFFHPDDRESLKAATMAAFAAKQPVREFVNRNIHKNGQVVWLATSGIPLLDGKGNLVGYRGVDVDITERKRAEEALATSEKRFRDIAEHGQHCIWEIDAEGRYTYVNEAVKEILGYRPEEVLQKHFYDFFHPDDRESLKAATREMFAAKKTFRQLISRSVHKNGQTVWLATSGLPLLDEKGNLIGYQGVGTDITERKRAQEALATSEKRFRDVADHAQECFWEIDAKGRYTYVSQTIKRILGYTPEEVLQKNYHDFFHPDDRESLKVAAQAFFAQKQPFRGLIDRNVHKNGQTIWFASSGIPLLDEKGNLLGYRGVSMDITERKQAEEALRESRRALFTLMSNLPGMAYRCHNDEDWTMEFVSQGALALTGYTAEELMQSARVSYAQIIHPDDRNAVWDAVQTALKARQPFQIIYRIITATGGENWVWEKGQGVYSEQGELVALEGFIADITERKRAEEALRESEERFRLATATARDALIMMDHQGKISFWNRAAEEMLGYSASEALGQDVHALLAPERYQQDIQKGFAAFQITGQGAVLGHTVELAAVRKDGREIPVALSLSAAQIKGQWNSLAILRDITERKRAEEILATSERRFRDIADHAQEWIWEINTEGRFIYASPAVEKILGYTPEEMVQKHFEDVFPLEDRETVKVMATAAFAQQQPFREFINRNVHKDGQIVWLLSSGFPLLDEKGNMIGYRGVDTDITERKRAEEALLLKDSALSSSANAVVINGLDGRTIYFNDSFLSMCGYTREEASQLTAFDLYSNEDSQRAFTELGVHGCYIGEGVARRKDGSTFPVAISASTIKDGNGRPISTMSSFFDISKRKQAEDDLRASEGRFRSLFDNMAEGVALHETVCDEHGVVADYRLLDVNRQYEAMIGLKRDQVVGKLATEVYKSETAPFLKEYAQVGETGRPSHFEIYYAPIKKQLDISVAPLGPGRWATIFSDITERKRSEHLLRLNAERVQVLLKLNQMTDASLQQITDFALEEAVRITQSEMGYLAFVNADETVLTMHSWSKQAMKECAVANKPVDYILSETGLWGEAVRQRQPIITNDYAAPHPAKKGHPAGHVPVRRHMNVPVFAGKHIVLVAGVGNKEDEYDNADVEQLTLLMEGMWRLIERKRVEEALRESELFLKETQKIGRIGGWKANLETGCVEGTEGVYRIFEVPLGFKLGLDEALTFVMPEYVSIMRERMQQAITTGEPFQMECEIVTGTGKHLWVEMRGRVAGAAPRLMGTFQDITARKKVEEALRESELFLREAQKIGRLGGWKACPATGYIEGTEGAYNILEVPLSGRQTIEWARKFIVPEYLPVIRERLQRTLTMGEPLQVECEIITGTGKRLWIELRGLPQGTADKEPRVMGTLQDITERKRSEEALRESELFLREAQSIGRIGGWKANPETGYVEWTEGIYHMLEIPMDHKPGFEEALKYFLPQYIPIIRERMQRTLATGEPFQMECEIVTATGKRLQGELRGLPHQSTAGKAPCVMGSFQDITKRKRSEEALRESELFLRETQTIGRIGGWKANPETDYLEWTEGIYRLIEAPLDYKPGLSEGLKFYLPHYIPIIREQVQRTLTTGEPFQMECEIVTTTGKHLWTELCGLTHSTAGEAPYVTGTLQDITKRKLAEEALRENELFLRESQIIGRIGGWKANPETDYLECTEGIYRILGVPLEYKPGFTEALKFFIPQYVPVIRERLMRTLTTGEPFQMECEVVTATDAHLWTELRGFAQGIAGKTLCVIGTLQDITERKRAEAVLRKSEESLRQILESVGFGVVIVGQDRKIRQVNHAALEMMGLGAEEELVGRICHDSVCPADRDKCPIFNLGQKVDKSERTMLHKNGSRVPILKSVTPITLGGEEVLLESFVDITERKQAEDALSAQRRQLTDIIEFLPDATLAIDREGRVIIWNKAIEEMTGIPASEMLGRTGYAHAVAFYGEARPQLVDLALQNHEEVVDRYSKITREGDTLAAEVFCRALYSKKGAWVFAKASPLHDQSGNIVGAIESVRDITRRKRAEEELQFRNVLLFTQQEASIEGSLVVDEENRILAHNRRFIEMWGIPAHLLEDGYDEQVLQFVTAQLADPGSFYQRVQYLYEHRHETARDELVLADGRFFDRYSAPMFGPGERYYGRVWYFRDITERKKAEQELGRLNADLAHKNRELQNILFAASHDLRSPLLNIHGFGKRLEDACTELRKLVDQPNAGAAELQKIAPLVREGMPKALGFIRSGAARMDTLISGMLRLSRLGRVEMKIEPLDVSKIVAEVVNSMASEIQSAGGAVHAGSLPACQGDAVLVSQVFANLIENAIKYRDPAKPVRIDVSGNIKDAEAVYCVADNGIGIAASDQERIWNLFCRLNPAATAGEGLGLNLVRRIVERHNGRVWVESAPGAGSKFFVALSTAKTATT